MTEVDKQRRRKHFFTYYREVLRQIEKLPADGHGATIKKLSFAATLDALGKAAVSAKTNRQRFTDLISEYTGWVDASRISLPHLHTVLSRAMDPDLADLLELATTRINTWLPGEVVPLSRDLAFDEARELWPDSKTLFISSKKVRLEHLQHAHLLYSYRNRIVHEFRRLLDPLDMGHDREPSYLHQMGVEPAVDRWYLQYTLGFWQGIARGALERLDAHTSRHDLDPTARFATTDYLLDALSE